MLTWEEVERYLIDKKSIIIPLGSIEQHSLALPLGTDTFIARSLAKEVGDRTSTLVMPVLSPGLSLVPHMAFPGTVSLRPYTFQKVIEEVISSLYQHGFRQMLLINAHGLNMSSIMGALQELTFALGDLRVIARSWWELPSVRSIRKVYFSSSGHATAEEISMMLYLKESLVKKEKFSVHKAGAGVMIGLPKIKEFTPTGLINGDQSEADRDLGEKLFNKCVEGYIELLQELESK